MVISSACRVEQNSDDDHREDTPHLNLGISDYDFRRLALERQKYNPIRNNIFTVEEMMRLKLVGRIIDKAQFKNEFEKTLVEYSNLPPESLKLSKELIRSNIKGTG